MKLFTSCQWTAVWPVVALWEWFPWVCDREQNWSSRQQKLWRNHTQHSIVPASTWIRNPETRGLNHPKHAAVCVFDYVSRGTYSNSPLRPFSTINLEQFSVCTHAQVCVRVCAHVCVRQTIAMTNVQCIQHRRNGN